jgi:hypothetical protein
VLPGHQLTGPSEEEALANVPPSFTFDHENSTLPLLCTIHDGNQASRNFYAVWVTRSIGFSVLDRGGRGRSLTTAPLRVRVSGSSITSVLFWMFLEAYAVTI